MLHSDLFIIISLEDMKLNKTWSKSTRFRKEINIIMYDYNPYRQPFNGYPQMQGNYPQAFPQRYPQLAAGDTQRFVLINGFICASNCGTITTIPAPAPATAPES